MVNKTTGGAIFANSNIGNAFNAEFNNIQSEQYGTPNTAAPATPSTDNANDAFTNLRTSQEQGYTNPGLLNGSQAISNNLSAAQNSSQGTSFSNPADSLLNAGSSLATKGFNNSSIIGGVQNTVDQFGASNLGMSTNGAPIGDIIGPTQGGVSLSGALGAAGIGATIGAINPFAKNKTGSEVGGAAGSLAGEFIGDSLGVPILGKFVGGAIGSALGGMFGPGKSTVASEFSGSLSDKSGNLNNLSFASEGGNTDLAKGVSSQVQSVTSLLAKHGIDTSGIQVHGGSNTKQAGGGFIDFGDGKASPAQMAANRITFNANDPNSINQAVTQFGNSVLKMKGLNTTMQDYTSIIPGQPGSSNLADYFSGNIGTPMVQTNRGPSGVKTFQDFLTRYRQQG